MRRTAFMIMLFAAALTFAACDEEPHSYLPDSHWILHADGMAEGHRLALTFHGETLDVADGSHTTPPFSASKRWDYYVTSDGVLHISRTESDPDGGTTTYSYNLDYNVSDDGLTLALTYAPTFGNVRNYLFDRR